MNSLNSQRALGKCLEKRKHPRMPCSAPIEYATQDGTFRNLSRDVSIGGLFVETWDAFSVGEKITVTLPVEKQKPVKLKGEVVRVERQGIGIAFV